MKDDAPTGYRHEMSLRSVLLAVQVAVSLVLLIDASLVTRAIQRVAVQDTGFVDDDVSVVTFELPASYDTARRRAFAQQLLLRGGQAVAPRASAFTDTAPFARGGREWATADLPGGRAGLDTDVLVREISPAFFDLLQVPLGRGDATLTTGDVAGQGVLDQRVDGAPVLAGRERARTDLPVPWRSACRRRSSRTRGCTPAT